MPASIFIPDQVIFSVPGALWAFSLTWFMEIVWNENDNKNITNRVLIFSLIITIGHECLQYLRRDLGWFSFQDVAWILVSLFAFKLIRSMNYAYKKNK
ncbi:MAG: hypothetical protein ACFBSF_21470 [Leptolyngbyaceae cyanobacterium]